MSARAFVQDQTLSVPLPIRLVNSPPSSGDNRFTLNELTSNKMPTYFKGPAREVLALNTYIKFMRASESLGARLMHCHTLGDITSSQFSALEALYHLGPLRQNQIGAKMLRSAGNMTLVIDNLEKAGLVNRMRATDDRRA